ncbi:MFS transporter [Paenibacillus larvae]|uniref:MFS transporter n=1 Tax=Paenibacillus larvae TaxID=1464 RepID=UPI00228148D7|nr:MFS transporter [Paenibacillus larvae]MCY9509668.1 MFS transporter [Paenibacillus larvae]MCY9526569.1 MFS transporter [Paenibacillus larvae]
MWGYLSPKAGIWIDRYNKRKVLFAASLVRCLAPLVMFVAIRFDSVACMLLAFVIMQIAASVYRPAVQSSLPAVVKPANLLKANGIFLNVDTLQRIGGTALGGIMVATLDLFTLYALSLVFYILLVFCTFLMDIPESEQSATTKGGKLRFREVFPLIRSEPSVLIAMVNTAVLLLFLTGFNLLILNFSELQQAPDLMGWLYAVEGLSIMFFAAIAKRWIGSKNLVTGSILFMFLFAISFVGMSFSESRLLVILSFGIFGCAFAFFFPMITTIYQLKLPDEARGRFFSFKSMMDRIMNHIALLVTGACLDWIGISAYMIILAVMASLSGAITFGIAKKKSIEVRQQLTGTVSV